MPCLRARNPQLSCRTTTGCVIIQFNFFSFCTIDITVEAFLYILFLERKGIQQFIPNFPPHPRHLDREVL